MKKEEETKKSSHKNPNTDSQPEDKDKSQINNQIS